MPLCCLTGSQRRRQNAYTESPCDVLCVAGWFGGCDRVKCPRLGRMFLLDKWHIVKNLSSVALPFNLWAITTNFLPSDAAEFRSYMKVAIQGSSSISQFLTGRTIRSPNILRIVRRTIIRFLIELRRTFSSPNLVRAIRRTTLRFLTGL